MSKKTAIKTMLILLSMVLIFHVLIFTQQIPYDKVWAGRLNSVEEMKAFETVSILVNIFIMIILLLKYRLLKKGKQNLFVYILIWGFVILFAVNTVGNLFAQNIYELIFGTLGTLTASILCFIIVKKEKPLIQNQ